MGKVLEEEAFWAFYWDFEAKDLDILLPGKCGAAVKLKPAPGDSFLNEVEKYSRRGYHDYYLWDVLYKRYLPKDKKLKVLEIGSAPGTHLVRLKKVFGYDPYGVEFSERGVLLNREIFGLNGIDPAQVISADFFLDTFQDKYRGFFDIVISRGFIEDFPDKEAEGIIEKHLNLLAEGGYLLISLPNLGGIYSFWSKYFDRKLFLELNSGITSKKRFIKLFDRNDLSGLFCGCYGTFNCGGRFSLMRNSTAGKFIFAFLDKLQEMFNVLFRVILRERGLDCWFFSPYLLYIGLKKTRLDRKGG